MGHDGEGVGTETQCRVVRLGMGAQRRAEIRRVGPEEATKARLKAGSVMRRGGQEEGQQDSDFYVAPAKALAPYRACPVPLTLNPQDHPVRSVF